MPDPILLQGNIVHHVVKFGIDVYPPIEPKNDRTRLNMFFEDANSRYPNLLQKLLSGEEFKIQKSIPLRAGQGATDFDIVVLTSRGPVFVFPFRLPDPIGEVDLGGDYLDLFRDLRQLFMQKLPNRKSLRVGFVRELMFTVSGEAQGLTLLGGSSHFAGAKLVGGQHLGTYRDGLYNIRVSVEPGTMTVQHRAPALGAVVAERREQLVIVSADVNTHEIKPLGDADIDGVIEKATSLWPDQLLEFLNERAMGDGS